MQFFGFFFVFFFACNLKTSWTPVDELDGAFAFYGGNGGIDVFGCNIATVEHAASHVLTTTRITLNHLVTRFETSCCDISHGHFLMSDSFSRHDWCVGNEWEVNPWVRHQIGLEFSEIDVESAVETQ